MLEDSPNDSIVPDDSTETCEDRRLDSSEGDDQVEKDERRFWGILWGSFVKTCPALIGVAGALIGIAAWLDLGPEWVVVAVAAGFALVIIATLLHGYITTHAMIMPPAPKVTQVSPPFPPHEKCAAVLLIAYDPRFLIGTTVAISRDDGGFDKPVGMGRVVPSANEGAQVQIVVEHLYDRDVELTKDDVRKALILRPQMPTEHFAYMLVQQRQKDQEKETNPIDNDKEAALPAPQPTSEQVEPTGDGGASGSDKTGGA